MSSGGLFSFNPAAGETPETLKRRRAVAEAMLASAAGQPATTIGGGLAALGQAIGGRLALGRVGRAEAAGQASANADFAKVLAGFGGGGTPVVVDALAGGRGSDVLAGGDNDFIAAMTPYAKSVAAKTGLDPNLILAQSALETGWGKKASGNNYFGIKGPGQITPTREFVNGQPVAISASFRAYDNPEASFNDYADFIGGDRYAGVRAAKTLEDQARALQEAGYATDPEYANKLIDIGNRIRQGGGGGASAVTAALGGGSTGGYIDLSPLAKISSRDAAQGVGTPIQQPRGLVIHHTGGRGTAEDVMTTLNQRGFSVQYVIDRDGKIYQTLPEGTAGQHIRTSKGGLSNANTFGVEVIANDDSDVTPAQIEAARKLSADLGGKYGFDANSVFGHGEINPHKQHTEGSTIVNAIRGGGGGTSAVTAALAGTEPISGTDPAAAAAGVGPGPGAGPPIREPLAAPAAPVVPPVAPPAAPAAPAAAGVAPVARALGIDPLPQTSGLQGPVASAGHESLSPHIAAVANALRPSPAAAAPPGSVVAAPAGGGGGAPAAAAVPPTAGPEETAALPGTEPVAGVPATAAPAAGGFSPRALAAIQYLQNPWGDESTKAIAAAIVKQELESATPLARAQLEKTLLDIEQQRNPPKSRDLTSQEVVDRGYDPDRRYRESPEGTVTEVPGTARETAIHENLVIDKNTGEVIATIPDPGYRAATPEEAAKYGAVAGQFDLSNNKFEPINPPSGMSVTVGPDGTVTLNQGPGAGKLTEGQSKDTVYVTRAEGSLPTLDTYGDALMDFPMQMAEKDPTGFFRSMQSPEFQLAHGAGLEFLQAILRKDTAAAITPAETDEYSRVYLPQPGDGPERLEYKRQARRRAVEAIKAGLPPEAILRLESASQVIKEKTGTTGEVIEVPTTADTGQGVPAAETWPTAPSGAVQELKRDPSAEAKQEFDDTFGPGAAARVLGGG